MPVEMVPELKDGKERLVERKLFPGYVLVKMVMTDESWYIVRNCRGVTGFVGPSSKPEPLSDEEAEKLGMNTKAELTLDYAVGDNVQITGGPLEGFVGVVDEIDLQAAEGEGQGLHVRARNSRRTGTGPGETPVRTNVPARRKTSVRAAKCGFYRVRHSAAPVGGPQVFGPLVTTNFGGALKWRKK